MAQLFKNNAAGKLAVPIDSDDTSLVLGSGQGASFPTIVGQDYFVVTLAEVSQGKEVAWEIVKVTGRVGDTFNIERAQEGTIARSWSADTIVELRLTAQSIEGLVSASDISVIEYDNRGELRLTEGVNNKKIIVSNLGLFTWSLGSDEPDDDESCFKTQNGAWLLQVPHWDVVRSWIEPDLSSSGVSVLRTVFTQTILSVTSSSFISINIPLEGAMIGDAVIVVPNNRSETNPNGIILGVVSSRDMVTIHLCSIGSTSRFATGEWTVLVIKI